MALLFNEPKDDDVFTLSLPNSDLVFTRYLYIKDEVKVALLLSLLNNKKEDAIFWTYELYSSGFKQETFKYIWQIYYDFYATLNPTFEEYFIKKHSEWVNSLNDDIIGLIVNNLLVRPNNPDVYLLRQICNQFEIEVDYKNAITSHNLLVDNISYWIENEDYRSLSQTILFTNYKYNYTLLYTDCLIKIFSEFKKNNLIRSFANSLQVPVSPKVILLAKLLELCTRKKGIQQSKSIYQNLCETKIDDLTNDFKNMSICKPYNVLKNVTKCAMNEISDVGVFKLVRNKYSEMDLKKKWLKHWEYHASFSPLWFSRIKSNGGYIDYINKRICFINDDYCEEFYEQYGYETDEQPMHIQKKIIGLMANTDKNNWLQLSIKNRLFTPYDEELEELEYII